MIDRSVIGESEFEAGIKYALFICREKPHLIKSMESKKPGKGNLFEQGLLHGITSHRNEEKRKQKLALTRSNNKQGHEKDR